MFFFPDNAGHLARPQRRQHDVPRLDLDPFGYTAERRTERALVPWFEQVVSRLLDGVNDGNVAERAKIVRRVLDIRGFGPVKAQAIQAVRAEVDAALSAPKPSGLAGSNRKEDESPRPS